MRQGKQWFTLLMLGSLLWGCSSPPQRTAQAEVQDIVQHLPQILGFDFITQQATSFASDETGHVCTYGRTWVVLGTHTAAQEALEHYAGALQSLDFHLESHQLELSRHLTRGVHERVVVGAFGPVEIFRNNRDYMAAVEKYQTVMTVRVDYILPNRDEC